jgi:hypothetical protein
MRAHGCVINSGDRHCLEFLTISAGRRHRHSQKAEWKPPRDGQVYAEGDCLSHPLQSAYPTTDGVQGVWVTDYRPRFANPQLAYLFTLAGS